MPRQRRRRDSTTTTHALLLLLLLLLVVPLRVVEHGADANGCLLEATSRTTFNLYAQIAGPITTVNDGRLALQDSLSNVL